MRHNIFIYSPLGKKERGSSLVIAIFILVVMSVLGAAMINMLRSNEQTYAYEVLGTRAYAAAQSGVQRKLQELFPLGEGTNISQCSTESTFSFTNHEGLNSCQATVSCSSKLHAESVIRYFTVSSNGQCDINGEKTSRTIEVRAKAAD